MGSTLAIYIKGITSNNLIINNITLRTGRVKCYKDMDLIYQITKCYVIEIINPKTGDVDHVYREGGKKFNQTALINVLTKQLGWTYGDSLLFHRNGDIFVVTDEANYILATIGKKLGESFRNMPYAKFVYKH